MSNLDLERAVLRRCLRFWDGSAASRRRPSEDELDQEQQEIARLRAWVKTLDRVAVRRVFREWLAFAQSGLNEARREMRHGARRRSLDEDRTKARADQQRAEALAATLPEPPPR